MSKPDEMGLTPEAAKGYEEFFVPAIFNQWPPVLMTAAAVSEGQNILDVGCGTGVLTRELFQRVGRSGSVTGFDLSQSMLDVAKVQCPEATFKQGDVTKMPFASRHFHVVISAFMLMFVPDPVKALREMRRVLKVDGCLVVSVWEGLENNVVYGSLVEATREVLGSDSAKSMAWPFTMGEEGRLESIFESAGMAEIATSHHVGSAHFPSVEDFVSTEIQAWLLAGSTDQREIDEIVRLLRTGYPPFENTAGEVSFPLNALIGRGNAVE
ncbi:MAG: methyltransferase domain-containing protein [Pseudomonadota bacterium]